MTENVKPRVDRSLPLLPHARSELVTTTMAFLAACDKEQIDQALQFALTHYTTHADMDEVSIISHRYLSFDDVLRLSPSWLNPYAYIFEIQKLANIWPHLLISVNENQKELIDAMKTGFDERSLANIASSLRNSNRSLFTTGTTYFGLAAAFGDGFENIISELGKTAPSYPAALRISEGFREKALEPEELFRRLVDIFSAKDGMAPQAIKALSESQGFEGEQDTPKGRARTSCGGVGFTSRLYDRYALFLKNPAYKKYLVDKISLPDQPMPRVC